MGLTAVSPRGTWAERQVGSSRWWSPAGRLQAPLSRLRRRFSARYARDRLYPCSSPIIRATYKRPAPCLSSERSLCPRSSREVEGAFCSSTSTSQPTSAREWSALTSRRTALPSRVTPPRFFRVHKTPRARRCVRLQRSQCWTQSAACCSAIATAPYRGPPHSARPRRCRLRDAHACAVRRIFRQLLIGGGKQQRCGTEAAKQVVSHRCRRRPSPTVADRRRHAREPPSPPTPSPVLLAPHTRCYCYGLWCHGVCVCGVRRPGVGVMCIAR